MNRGKERLLLVAFFVFAVCWLFTDSPVFEYLSLVPLAGILVVAAKKLIRGDL